MRYSAFLLIVLTSCVAKPIISMTACNDPLYLKLKQKPIEQMTPREFAYYQAKDQECAEAHADASAANQMLRNPFTTPIDSLFNDSLYSKLRSMPLDSMNDREFAYFLMKDREYESAKATSNAITQLQIGEQKNAMLFLAIMGTLTVVLYAFQLR